MKDQFSYLDGPLQKNFNRNLICLKIFRGVNFQKHHHTLLNLTMNQPNIANLPKSPEVSGRVKEIIQLLGLEPHPEGGYFKQMFRSGVDVVLKDNRGDRRALTHIYYLLSKGDESVWHMVKSEEIWNFYEGDGLELRLLKLEDKEEQVVNLGQLNGSQVPSFVIPANVWQTAKPLGEYALVGCIMAPGFEWDDWKILPEGIKSPLDIKEAK